MWFDKYLIVFVLLFVPLYAPSAGAERVGDVVDMVLASIDGEPVTMSDLRQFIVSHGETPPPDLLDGSAEVRKALRELLIEELIGREAASAGISVSDEEMEAYVEEIKRQNQVDDKGFADLLASKGLTIDIYQKQVRADILRTRILSSRVRGKVNILDVDIQKYLEEHPSLMPQSGEQRIEQITFPVSANATEQERAKIREEAEEALEDVREGAAMNEVGKDRYTDLGFVDPDDLKTELQTIAEKLEPGAVSDVAEVPSGFTFLKLTTAAEGKVIDGAMKEQVRRELFEKQFKEAADRFLNDELPKKYHVELKL